jgi:ubiquinone/menaquinone biosynthesis C-methylase UbiE
VIEQDITKMPFENESFDRIYGNYVIHLVPDGEAVVKEAYRLLANGGMAAFSVVI